MCNCFCWCWLVSSGAANEMKPLRYCRFCSWELQDGLKLLTYSSQRIATGSLLLLVARLACPQGCNTLRSSYHAELL